MRDSSSVDKPNPEVNSVAVARAEKIFSRDPELRTLKIDAELSERANAPELPLEQSIDLILDGYSQRPALGMRDYEILKDASGRAKKHYLPVYKMTSFANLRHQIRAIASAWRNEEEIAVGRDDFVIYIGFASVEYTVLDIASTYVQAVSVPLQSAAGAGELEATVEKTNPVAIAATMADLAVAARLVTRHEGVRSLIAFDYDERDDDDREQLELTQKTLEAACVETVLRTFQQLVERGSQYTWEFLPDHPEQQDRMVTLLHSSGSTGVPKGAVFDATKIKQQWNATGDQTPGVNMVLAPYNHGMGRWMAISALKLGCAAYFTLMPDMSTLFEDIRLARPTRLMFFPRILDLVFQHYKTEVSKLVRAGQEEAVARNKVKAEMRETFFGDRLLMATVGSAPCSQEVKDFVKDCFEITLVDAYGSTEIGPISAAVDGIIQRPDVIDYKLVDIPELGYYTTDLPHPRGEFRCKTRFQLKSYYKDEEATAELMDEDGFIRTGDIVEELAPDRIVLIDRRKDVIKLSQAEFVAVGPLGATFEAGSDVISQIYVYGNSLRSYLLAVVVPDTDVVEKRLGNGYSDLALKDLIREELRNVAKEKNLKSFEVPRDFIVEMEPFSQDNGLLTSVRKRKRPALKARYGDELEDMYAAQDDLHREEMSALKEAASTLSVTEKLTKLVAINLNLESVGEDVPRTFTQLGGDSLGAVGFSAAIEDVFGVSLPADSIISPTGSIQKWAKEIESLLAGDSQRPSFEGIHGKSATTIRAADFEPAKFLGQDFVDQAKAAPQVSGEEKVIVLTGANGFLGRSVCIQWMERLAANNGKVICIVRAAGNEAAFERLTDVFRGPTGSEGNSFEKRFMAMAEHHLEVLAGDAAEPLLGLDQATFDRVADEADRVCHVAALVNHRLGYEHLFAPNVAGTAEIIRLAGTGRKKPVDYVSTLGTLPLLGVPEGSCNEVPPNLSSSIELTNAEDAYGEGYSVSKWAGECLLLKANEELGIPVNILRGNMMLPDESYAGQINVADMFTRLLHSVIHTGLAPFSFYSLTEDGHRSTQHYNGSPANIVAASVVAAANRQHDICQAINMTNYHVSDGCSLDTFVDWIESAGYSVTRIEEYSEWFSRIREKLGTLPEEIKQQSALEVMAAYAEQGGEHTDGQDIDSDNYRRLVRTFASGEDLPHIDEAFIHKCLADMRLHGMIPDVA